MVRAYGRPAWLGLLLACYGVGACGEDAGPADPDAGPPDARRSQQPEADGGSLHDDAGRDAGDAADPTSCQTQSCLCAQYCAKVAQADCTRDPSESDCNTRCDIPPTMCEDEVLAWVGCQAHQPQSSFLCEMDLQEHLVLGCDAERDAFNTCSPPR